MWNTMTEWNRMMANLTRRQALTSAAAALAAGTLGPQNLLGAGAAPGGDPLAPRHPHYSPRAERVVLFFMTGGVSHVDSFDYKPDLVRDGGKALGPSKVLSPPRWDFKHRGRSGVEVSDLFPHIGSMADEICFINSMRSDHGNHYEATMGMHTGSITSPLPGLGAWVSYALGTLNRNLPSHVVFAKELPYAGSQVWDSNFLPACHQGVRILPGQKPIDNLEPASPAALQDLELRMLKQANQRHLEAGRGSDQQLQGRAMSFESARSLQNSAPEVFDLGAEKPGTLEDYGLGTNDRSSFAWQCLMTRRMLERGVRFVELVDVGSNNNWDAHGNIGQHEPLARQVDKPIGALIRDLKLRGLLDSTLIIWCTEFGRTPFVRNLSVKGREHHPTAFTCWLSGGGVKGGLRHGKSDQYGIEVAENPVHVHDFHATILHLLGLNHKRLTYHHAGRDFRLTDIYGQVIDKILA